MAERHMRAVGKRSQASGLALAILKEIALDIGRDDQPAYTSIRTLAERVRCSTKTVQRSIATLKELGEITTEKNGQRVYYTLTLSADSVEELPPSRKKAVPASEIDALRADVEELKRLMTQVLQSVPQVPQSDENRGTDRGTLDENRGTDRGTTVVPTVDIRGTPGVPQKKKSISIYKEEEEEKNVIPVNRAWQLVHVGLKRGSDVREFPEEIREALTSMSNGVNLSTYWLMLQRQHISRIPDTEHRFKRIYSRIAKRGASPVADLAKRLSYAQAVSS